MFLASLPTVLALAALALPCNDRAYTPCRMLALANTSAVRKDGAGSQLGSLTTRTRSTSPHTPHAQHHSPRYTHTPARKAGAHLLRALSHSLFSYTAHTARSTRAAKAHLLLALSHTFNSTNAANHTIPAEEGEGQEVVPVLGHAMDQGHGPGGSHLPLHSILPASPHCNKVSQHAHSRTWCVIGVEAREGAAGVRGRGIGI
jgi:hypothetical protein